MTTNATVLRDVLSRRIARGIARAGDLLLLEQLLRCQQRRCILAGTGVGVVVTALGLSIAYLVIH